MAPPIYNTADRRPIEVNGYENSQMSPVVAGYPLCLAATSACAADITG
jgi:hypothetical protein